MNETPHSLDAERAILGAILIGEAAYPQTTALAPEDFFLDSHQRIFARMNELANSSRPIDALTLSEELRRCNELDMIGGVAYIASLISGLPDRPSIAHYVTMVRDCSSRRRFAKVAQDAQRLAFDPGVPRTALADAGSRLAEMATNSEEVLPPRFSEDALALRFSRQYADSLRFVNDWGRWMLWDGMRWREDHVLDVFDRARAICREASSEVDKDERAAGRLASKLTVAAVERLAQFDRRHAATTEQWDADPWLLNTPTGTVNLKTGEVQEHCREHYITKLTGAGIGGECPLWRRFLDRVTDDDANLQAYLQRMIGYCLTGSTKEHALFFAYGTGGNGKSVFLKTISDLMGDYAKNAPESIFTDSKVDQHPTDLAGLRGFRFVPAIETEAGRWWAEARIKSLTGGDRVTARFMRQDFFEYTPQFKLIVAGNHKPGLHNVDEGMRRRLHLIPFTVTIRAAEKDLDLTEKLKAEGSGIMQWAVEGCLAWQREGLNPPSAVRAATEDYLASEDLVGRWLEERCIQTRNAWTSSSALFADFQEWCEQSGESARWTQKRLTQALMDRGFKTDRTNSKRGLAGVGLCIDMESVTHVTRLSI